MRRALVFFTAVFLLLSLGACYIRVSNPVTGGKTPMMVPGPGGGPGQGPVGTGWNTFTDNAYGFQVQYPNGANGGYCGGGCGEACGGGCESHAGFRLPFTPGTNLAEKLMYIDVQINPATCQSPQAAGFAPGYLNPVNETINGLTWVEETFGQGAAGSLYQDTAYSTTSGSVCASLTFVLHSHNPGAMYTVPPTFNQAEESAVFAQIVNTFQWLTGSAVTPTRTPFAVTFIPMPLTPAWMLPTITPSRTLTPESYWTPTPTHVHVKLVKQTPTATHRPPAG